MFLVAATAAHAQQFDIAFGFGTVTGTSASNAGQGHAPQTISGGGYPSFSGDFLFFKRYFGIGGNVAWRANQNVDIFFTPYRPILYDFNAVYAPPLGKHMQANLQAGIGGESVRFYTPFFTCNFVGCTNFQSSNHFLGHVGGGLRFYVTRSIFLSPEAHFYFVNNNFEFAGPNVNRYAVSIGYSLKNKF
jgi:hypothetical protein